MKKIQIRLAQQPQQVDNSKGGLQISKVMMQKPETQLCKASTSLIPITDAKQKHITYLLKCVIK